MRNAASSPRPAATIAKVAGSGVSPSTANAERVCPVITEGTGFSTSTNPVTVGVALKYQLTVCVVAAGVGATSSSQYMVPAVNVAFSVDEACSN